MMFVEEGNFHSFGGTLVIKYVETSSIGKRISEYSKGGWKKNIKPSDIDFHRPIILCLGGAGVNDDKSANGVAKIAQTMLGRIGVENDEIQIFSAIYPEKKDVTVDVDADNEKLKKKILSTTIESSDYIYDIYKTMLFPVIENKSRNDKENITSILRNITIFAHCHGSFVADKIIRYLRRDMIYSGFKQKDIKEMLSEITTVMLSPREGVEKNDLSLNLAFTLASDNLGGNITFSGYKSNKEIENFVQKFVANKIKGKNNFCIKYNSLFYNFWDTDTFGADLNFRESRDADYFGSASNEIVHDSLFMRNDFHLLEQYYNPYSLIKDDRCGSICKNEKASNLTKIMIRSFQNAVSLSLVGEKRNVENLVSNDIHISYIQGENEDNYIFKNVEFDGKLDKLLTDSKKTFPIINLFQKQR